MVIGLGRSGYKNRVMRSENKKLETRLMIYKRDKDMGILETSII